MQIELLYLKIYTEMCELQVGIVVVGLCSYGQYMYLYLFVTPMCKSLQSRSVDKSFNKFFSSWY